ncbi:MAG: hypothetical protein ABSE08_10595 [Syntrophobacteraceae bacterium]|jgi:hypothetical protein
MKKKMFTLVLAPAVMICLGVFATQTRAEELKWKIISYISYYQPIPVGDEEGHILQVYERRGAVIFESGETAAILQVSTTDKTKEGQTGGGYWQITFKDGSTTWAKLQHTGSIPVGEKLQFIETKGEFTKGTGRFEGIKGSFACKGPFITPVTPDKTRGDVVLECTGTSILPHK